MQDMLIATPFREPAQQTISDRSPQAPPVDCCLDMPGEGPEDILVGPRENRGVGDRTPTLPGESGKGWPRIGSLLPPNACSRLARGSVIAAGGLGACALGVGAGVLGGVVVGGTVGFVVVILVGGSSEWENAVMDVCLRVAARTLGVVGGLLGAFVGSMLTWESITDRV